MPVALSLVIPAHNESARVRAGFARLRPVLEQFDPDALEVVVVDDGSTDDTGLTAADAYSALPHVRVVRQEVNLGKGAAVRLGFSVATRDHVVVCDADMAIDPVHLPTMVAALAAAPVAFGSRFDGGPIRYDSWTRTLAARRFNALVRRAVGTSRRDTQCGFKGFRLGAARLLGNLGLVRGFAFDVELEYLAGLLGWEVATVPVTWRDVAGSSVSVLGDSWSMVRDIRALRHRAYGCPTVRIPGAVDVAELRRVAAGARQFGLVVAQGDDALVALPRDAAVAGVTIAGALGGSLGTSPVAAFFDRRLIPV